MPKDLESSRVESPPRRKFLKWVAGTAAGTVLATFLGSDGSQKIKKNEDAVVSSNQPAQEAQRPQEDELEEILIWNQNGVMV